MPQDQQDPSSLSNLFVSSTNGAQVPLGAFTSMQRTIAPLTISHQAQFPAVTISFNLAPDASLSDAVAAISNAERDIGMPGTIAGGYSGDAAEFGRSLAGEPWLILAAAVTIYIVLGVLYESFIHPLTILSTLPSAGVGAIAEARRFPDLAATVSRTARDLSTELGVRLLGELTQSGELGSLPAFAPERLATTARLFLDLVAVPMLLRALFEVNLKTLDAEIDAHVARSVAFFLAACRNGGVSLKKAI